MCAARAFFLAWQIVEKHLELLRTMGIVLINEPQTASAVDGYVEQVVEQVRHAVLRVQGHLGLPSNSRRAASATRPAATGPGKRAKRPRDVGA